MSWARTFRIRKYVRGSLWVLPLLGAVLGAGLAAVDVVVDKAIHLPAAWTYSSSTATTVLSAIVGAMVGLTGFVVTVTVLIVQMATDSFSPRLIGVWLRDGMLKALLALMVGALAFSFALLRRVETDFVPNLGVSIAGLLVLASLVLFMVFLSSYLHQLRPVAVASYVAGQIHRDFRRLVAAIADAADTYRGVFEPNGAQPALVVRSAGSGAIQAIDAEGLARWARQHGCIVVLHHHVGDSVPINARLIEAYGALEPVTDRQQRALRGMVALGTERTLDQDPAFAIRIMVDIANLALSPAVNNPTTAVQVLDQLAEVLRLIGGTELSSSRLGPSDELRQGLVIPVRSWEDYLELGVTEIREFGSTSVQVVRRMRAMLEQLHEEVQPEHRPAVEDELARLEATVSAAFAQSVDLDRARVADPQGIGGGRAVEPRPKPAPTLNGRFSEIGKVVRWGLRSSHGDRAAGMRRFLQ
jgi:uncharacterized membrane protein